MAVYYTDTNTIGVDMYNTVENPIPKSNLFASPKTLEDLMDYCNLFTGSDKTLAFTVAQMALNLAHDLVEDKILAKDIFAQ